MRLPLRRGLPLTTMLFIAMGFVSGVADAQQSDDGPPTKVESKPAWIAYEPDRTSLKGMVRLHGSETMLPLMEGWAANFKRLHPDVEFEIRGEGSLLAVASFAEKKGAIGALSSLLNEELSQELAALGVRQVVQIPVAYDDVAVVVHPSIPVHQLTLAQLGGLFSASADTTSSEMWGDILTNFNGDDIPVVPVGSSPISGTRRYFAGRIFQGDTEYSSSLKQLDHHAAVVDAVKQLPGAIGYVSAAWLDGDSRVVGISKTENETAVLPGVIHDGQAAGDYPLRRKLYLAVSQDPEHYPSKLDREFLRYVVSREGMNDVRRHRFIPLTGRAYKDIYQQVQVLQTN